MDKRPSVLFLCSALFLFSTLESFAEAPMPNSPGWPRVVQKFPGPIAFKHRLLVRQAQQAPVDQREFHRFLAQQPKTSPSPPAKPPKSKCPPSCDGLFAKIQKHGPQLIVVNLKQADLPDFVRSPQAEHARFLEARGQAIISMQDRILDRLAARNIRVKQVTRSKYAPSIGITADSEVLRALMVDPEVESVEENVIMYPMLNQSIPLIGADVAWANGFTGSGHNVAVLDTGVDVSHPFLAGRVFAEHCFSTNDSGNDPVYGPWTITSLCPNGQTEQGGSGAARPCALVGCEHGTHVAGIAAGRFYPPITFSGVSRDSHLIAVQLFSMGTGTAVCKRLPSPCLITLYQNHQSALQYVSTFMFSNVVAANLSLGEGAYTRNCDQDSPWDTYKTYVDRLRELGIATVVASGNNSCQDVNGNPIGCPNALSAPACISTAISVGATTKSDSVASYSNSASFLSLLAPGGDGSGGSGDIYSSVPDGEFAYSPGTSMAAPHVAGAFAVLRHQSPSATVRDGPRC